MSKVTIFYHNDCDGHASGAILQRHLQEKNPIMIEINYGEDFPWDLIDSETEVWMADFSLEPWSDMIRLNNSCKEFVWIDHHKTAMESYQKGREEGNPLILGYRVDGTAACKLCWDYCNPETPEPMGIFLANVYDVWKWHDVEGAIEFQYGTRLFETDPATEEGQDFWDKQIRFPTTSYKEIVKQGKLLMDYQDRSAAKFMKKAAFETIFEGYKCIAVNRKGNSRQFNSVWDPNKYDFMLTFAWINNQWNVSLYGEDKKVDLGAIAKKYGGGGHFGAAGFNIDSLPFDLE
jgi:oligoribonuclease NrnB/cAMP/cGMP phosphodiesterase (DHH superfamily)